MICCKCVNTFIFISFYNSAHDVNHLNTKCSFQVRQTWKMAKTTTVTTTTAKSKSKTEAELS